MKWSLMRFKDDICLMEVPEHPSDSRLYALFTPEEADEIAQQMIHMVVEIRADLRNRKE